MLYTGADEQASGRTTLAPTTKGILKHTSSVKNDSQHVRVLGAMQAGV